MTSAGRPSKAGDDRILPVTRWVAVFIIPFLVVADVLLYAFPTRAGELFAWAIAPPLSAYLLASAYLGGVWFFLRVATVRGWHRVRHGFPAIVLFAGALLVATLLHLDRFSHNLSFGVWLTLYATTPFIIAVLAVVQAPRDPGIPDAADAVIAGFARIGLALIGISVFAFGAIMFAAPEFAVSFWAWKLTPLTSQVLGAVLSLTGVVNAALLWDSRASSFRILFQAQLLSLSAIALSLIAGRDDLLWDRPMTPIFIGVMVVGLGLYGGFVAWCEFSLRRAAASRVTVA
ncbi:hypothetical protein ACH3VR_17140 [Microbacterium sp. B2969]|uniref:Uncharacterized protein n=1 Tax=Microbacterium alkaliflavum TaxID=3248839 RepID=A0ABW7QCI4_9MICO